METANGNAVRISKVEACLEVVMLPFKIEKTLEVKPNIVFSCTQNAISMLKQEYKEGETNLQQALQLAVKVLSKTLDMTKLTAEKGECLFRMFELAKVLV